MAYEQLKKITASTIEHMLGAKVTDMVTGFTGTATGVSVYTNGCVRIAVEAASKDGKLADAWFDAQRLELIKKQPKHILMETDDNEPATAGAGVSVLKPRTGGPRPDPVTHNPS
jgi:hypothetical protein